MIAPPLVSVCIPVHNGGSVIERCVRSVLQQDLDSFEILVLDNASTDDTVERARAALGTDARGCVIVNPGNLGRIGNWNRCLEVAQGRYLKLLMVNDVLIPGSLQLLLRAIEGDDQNVMACSQHEAWDGGDQPTAQVPEPSERRVFRGLEALEALRDGFDPFWALNGMICRRQAVARAGLRFREDIAYTADKLFCVQLALQGTTTFLPTATYRFNSGAVGRFHFTGLEPRRFLDDNAAVFREIDEALQAHGRPTTQLARRLADAFLWWHDQSRPRPGLLRSLAILSGRPALQGIVAYRLLRRMAAATLRGVSRRPDRPS